MLFEESKEIMVGMDGELKVNGTVEAQAPTGPEPVVSQDERGRMLVDGHKRYSLRVCGKHLDYSAQVYGERVQLILMTLLASGFIPVQFQVIDTLTGQLMLHLEPEAAVGK
jgi:hypothetical protein